MSAWDKARDITKLLSIVVSACERIQALTHVGGEHAPEALKIIGAIVGSLQEGFAGKPAADVDAEIAKLQDALAAKDSEVARRISEHFKTAEASKASDQGEGLK